MKLQAGDRAYEKAQQHGLQGPFQETYGVAGTSGQIWE